jgi:hypothetical protein
MSQSLKPLPAMSTCDGQFNSSVSSNLSLQMAQLHNGRTTNESDSTNYCYQVSQITAVSIGEEGDDARCLQIDTGSPIGSDIEFPKSPPLRSCSATCQHLEEGLDRGCYFLDLSVSPLTSSSYHTMERYYDQDTWRMYNRIAASRCDLPQVPGTRSYVPSAELSEPFHPSSQSPQIIFERDEETVDEDGDDDEDLQMFDLDPDESCT